MTEITPLYMDINNAYSGDEFGLPWRDVMGEGVVGAGDLAVTAGTGNTVNVAAGAVWVVGDTNTNLQPTYRVYNDGVVNKGITPDPANPRIVLVVAQITDAGFSGAQRNWAITTIHGTPAVSPVAPALPASAAPLASILVPAAAASSAAYTITNLRTRAQVGGGQAPGSVVRLYDTLLTADTASFDFQNISQDYAALKVTVYGRASTAAVNDVVWIRFNNDATAIYDFQYVAGVAAAASAGETFAATSGNLGSVPANTAGANLFGDVEAWIPNYANAVNNKAYISAYANKWGVATGNIVSAQYVGFWRSNAAINRITVGAGGTLFKAGSRCVLYGLA